MLRVSINQLKPGMRLAKPVLNDSGMVLLPEGSELAQPMIERLNVAGISFVFIEGKIEPLKPLNEVLEEVNERFKKTENERHMDLLKKVLIEHLAKLYE